MQVLLPIYQTSQTGCLMLSWRWRSTNLYESCDAFKKHLITHSRSYNLSDIEKNKNNPRFVQQASLLCLFYCSLNSQQQWFIKFCTNNHYKKYKKYKIFWATGTKGSSWLNFICTQSLLNYFFISLSTANTLLLVEITSSLRGGFTAGFQVCCNQSSIQKPDCFS